MNFFHEKTLKIFYLQASEEENKKNSNVKQDKIEEEIIEIDKENSDTNGDESDNDLGIYIFLYSYNLEKKVLQFHKTSDNNLIIISYSFSLPEMPPLEDDTPKKRKLSVSSNDGEDEKSTGNYS